jgi:transketolase
MASRGLSVTHFHVTTLKPFQAEPILDAIRTSKYGAVTMENHSILGGLGSIVAEVMAEAGLGKKLVRIGIQDTFLHGASKAYLMKSYGLDAMTLIGRVETLIGSKLNIVETDLEKIRIASVHSQAKAEAL